MAMPDKEKWEREYKSGAWDRLTNNKGSTHCKVVAFYVQKKGTKQSILDAGCGSGSILTHLDFDLIEKYTGVDIAQAALDKIAPKRSQDEYICSTLEDYVPNGTWDVVLFNNILNYISDPVEQLKKFEKTLKPEGFFVISWYKNKRYFSSNNRSLRRVRAYLQQASYACDDAVELSNIDGSAAWEIFRVRPG
jgi:2-polyprenyl-3-methyl-5-hydroxy-6-metoxy-1,4-benzoquinol methylase